MIRNELNQQYWVMQFNITTVTPVMWRCRWFSKFAFFSDAYSLFPLDWIRGSLWVLCQEKKARQWTVSLEWDVWSGVHWPGSSWSPGVYEFLGPGSLPWWQKAKPVQAQTPHSSFRLLWLPLNARTFRASKGLCVPLLPGKSFQIKQFTNMHASFAT